MLNRYLEKSIKNKLELFSILHSTNPIAMKDLLSFFPMSINTINALINELNDDFTGLAVIQKSTSGFSIHLYEETTFMELLHAIYQDSVVLKCLKFMILNDRNCSLAPFIEENYIAKSSVYRIKQNCCEYLQQIGLDIRNNKVVGDEYRIRYLIALLHYKYGINCYEITNEEINMIRNFILSTNKSIDRSYLDMTPNEYGYFEYLFFLAWKRIDYMTEPICSQRLETCKRFFVYARLKEALKNTLEPLLQVHFSEQDFDYFYLIYCSTNSCMFADQWTQKELSYLHATAFEDKEYCDLYLRIKKILGEKIAGSHVLQSTLIYFSKKCLLELQCLILDKNFYLYSKRSQLTRLIVQIIEQLLSQWKTDNAIRYEIDKDHVFYLALQIEQIIKKSLPPVPLFILSELTSELEVISNYLRKFFPPERVEIKPFLLGAEDKESICSQKRSVIVTNKKFKYLMENWKLEENNTVLLISVEVNTPELTVIHEAVTNYETEGFLDFVSQMQE